MKANICPVCHSVMEEEGQTYYCYSCNNFADNLNMPDEDRDYLQEAMKIAEGHSMMIPERAHLMALYEYSMGKIDALLEECKG